MERTIKFYINPKKVSVIERGGEPVMWHWEVNGAYEVPFEIEPTIGEHDFNTCQGCQKQLARITEHLTKTFNGEKDKPPFPSCCQYHKQLLKLKDFNQADFIKVPDMVARKVIYTNQHILNNISTENWYKEITFYIDYAIDRFGQMPNGCGERLMLGAYLHYISQGLKTDKRLSKEKASRILEYLKAGQTPPTEKATDFNILFAIYQQWLKEFPFELNSYFSNLKQHFSNYLPLMRDKSEYNPYLKMSVGKSHTKSSLFEMLITITNDLLTQINGDVLYESGVIKDADKIQVELIRQERKQQVKDGYNNQLMDEKQRYGKMIMDWLAHEQAFWAKLAPLFKKSNNAETQIDKNYKSTQVPTQYTTLDELFKPEYQKKILEFVELLMKIEAPAINEDCLYIGKDKGVISVWFNTLENKGIVEKLANDIQRANLLNKKFASYEVPESHFRTERKRATEMYKNFFDAEISAIKTKKD